MILRDPVSGELCTVYCERDCAKLSRCRLKYDSYFIRYCESYTQQLEEEIKVVRRRKARKK